MENIKVLAGDFDVQKSSIREGCVSLTSQDHHVREHIDLYRDVELLKELKHGYKSGSNKTQGQNDDGIVFVGMLGSVSGAILLGIYGFIKNFFHEIRSKEECTVAFVLKDGRWILAQIGLGAYRELLSAINGGGYNPKFIDKTP